MKAKILFYLLLSPYFLKAQITKFTVKGVIADTAGARYAYLTSLSRQNALSSDLYFKMVPIVNGKFEISGTFDLKGKPYQQGILFIHHRANITKKEIQSKFEHFIWPAYYSTDYKSISLETMTVAIPSGKQVNEMKVTEGGKITALRAEYNLSAKQGGERLIALLKANPDAQASLELVTTQSWSFSYRDTIKTYWGTPLTLFTMLSDRLQNSKEGKSLKQKMDSDSKL